MLMVGAGYLVLSGLSRFKITELKSFITIAKCANLKLIEEANVINGIHACLN